MRVLGEDTCTARGWIGGQPVTMLLDTGAQLNVVDTRTASRLGLVVSEEVSQIVLGDRSRVNTLGIVKSVKIFGHDSGDQYWSKRTSLHVLDLPQGTHVILGMPTMSGPLGMILDLAAGAYYVREPGRCTVGWQRGLRPQQGDTTFLLHTRQLPSRQADRFEVPLLLMADGGALQGQDERVHRLVNKFPAVFPLSEPATLPPERPGFDHKIEVTEEGRRHPKAKRAYRLSPAEREAMMAFLAKQRAAGHIRVSKSPWGAPVLFVRKKDGSLRMCYDYRELNSVTVRNNYAPPRMEDLLDALQGAKCFSTLDLWAAFNQLRVEPESQKFTAFVTPVGSFECTVCPFGLTNMPATFSTFMAEIFDGLLGRGVLCYLDDIIVYTATWEEHEPLLEKVVAVLQKNSLKCKLKKCEFFRSTVDFVGYRVSDKGLQPQSDKVAALKNMGRPRSRKAVRQLLGMFGFYAKFIRRYAEVAAPLTDSLRNTRAPFTYTANMAAALQKLIDAMTSAPVLRLPRGDLPMIVHVDTSMVAVGGALMQEWEDGLHPVAFFSHKLPKLAVRQRSITELEMLGLYHVMKEWRIYLEGTTVTIYTDHRSLAMLRSQKELTRAFARMLTFLETHFHYTIVWRPGHLHLVADTLSRLPDGKLMEAGGDPLALSLLLSSESILEEQELIEAYKKDKFCMSLMTGLKKNPKAFPRFELRRDGILILKEGERVVVPDNRKMKLTVLAHYHDGAMGAHTAATPTYQAVRRHYFWSGMGGYIYRYCRSCPVCRQMKITTRRMANTLQPLPIPERPFESISMDFLSLGMSDLGHDSLLIIVDRFSKYLTAIPCLKRDTAQQTLQRFVAGFLRHHPWPREIVSDRDPKFTADVWQKYFREWGIALKMSTADHPQTDGQSERTIRTITQLLRASVNREEGKWESFLPWVEMGYNARVHTATGDTPAYVATGDDLWVPGSVSGEGRRTAKDSDLAAVWDATRDQLIHSETQAIQQANKRRTARVELRVGDRVYLSTQSITIREVSEKFKPKFIGPYRIEEIVGHGSYRLALPPGLTRLHPVFNVDKLLLAPKDDEEFAGRGNKAVSHTGEEEQLEEFEVEKITDAKRGDDGTIQVKVHFKGYVDPEWLDAECCDNAKELLADCAKYVALQKEDDVRRQKEVAEKAAAKALRESARRERGVQRQRRKGYILNPDAAGPKWISRQNVSKK